MNKDIALRAAEELVLKTMLRDIAGRPRSCSAKGRRCLDVPEFGWWDYCDPCKASCFLAELFPEEKP